MSKETFKLFVKKHPELAEYVVKHNISFQKFYEIYDIYGEDVEVWSKYFKEEKDVSKNNDFLSKLKNADPKELQKGIGNIKKVLSMFEGGASTTGNTSYEERPMYKYFED